MGVLAKGPVVGGRSMIIEDDREPDVMERIS